MIGADTVALRDNLPFPDGLLQIGDVSVEPVPQRRPLVSAFDSKYFKCRVVEIATVIERELLIQVALCVSSGHPLAGFDGSRRGFRRRPVDIGDKHHFHIDNLSLEVALNTGRSTELMLGEHCYGTVENRPEQFGVAAIE